jgi:activator of HSP90 ATPase
MTLTLTITAKVTANNKRGGQAEMTITIPDKMMDYIDLDKLSLDLPALIKAAFIEYSKDTLGKDLK